MEIGSISSVTINTHRSAESGSSSPVSVTAPTSSVSVQTVDAVQPTAAAPSLDQVKQAVDSINQSMQSLSRGLEFSIDEDSERIVVKVVDPSTNETIRQIPTVETLAIAKSLDQVLGTLIRERA